MILGQEHQTVTLGDGEKLLRLGRGGVARAGWTVELDPWQLSPRERGDTKTAPRAGSVVDSARGRGCAPMMGRGAQVPPKRLDERRANYLPATRNGSEEEGRVRGRCERHRGDLLLAYLRLQQFAIASD
jgi:hypothetical protein